MEMGYGYTLSGKELDYNNDSHYSLVEDPNNYLGITAAVVVILEILLGSVGNVLVILAVMTTRALRKSCNAFIVTMAVTDVLFNTTVMPFYVITFIHRQWSLGEAWCKFNTYLGVILACASVLQISAIAFYRYLLIVYPHNYGWFASRRNIALGALILFTYSTLVIFPNILHLDGEIAYTDQLGRCNYIRHSSKGTLYWFFCATYLPSGGLMLFFYWRIMNALKASNERIKEQTLASKSPYATLIKQSERIQPPNDGTDEYENTPKDKGLGQIVQQIHTGFRKTSDSLCTNVSARGEQTKQSLRQHTCTYEEVEVPDPNDGKLTNLPHEKANRDSCNDFLTRDLTQEKNRDFCNDFPNKSLLTDADAKSQKQKNSYERRVPTIKLDFSQQETSTINEFNSPQNLTRNPKQCSRFSVHKLSVNQPHETATTSVTSPTVSRGNSLSLCSSNTQSSTVNTQSFTQSPCLSVFMSDSWDNRWSSAFTSCPDANEEETNKGMYLSVTEHLSNSIERKDCAQGETTLNKGSERNERHLHGNHGHTNGNSHHVHNPPTSHQHANSFKMILAIFAAFLITYMPYTIVNLVDSHGKFSRVSYILCSLFFWMGSCVNPWIYGVMNRNFRQSYKTLLLRLLGKSARRK